jgi:hypothetical protein
MGMLVAGVLLAGCSDSSSGGTSGNQTTGTSPGGTQASTPTPGGTTGTGAGAPAPGPVVALGDADKGKTVNVAVGQQVTVTLTGADWRFVNPTPATVLTPSSPPVVANGTTSISYRGAKAGTATATASRGADTYVITVVVQ